MSIHSSLRAPLLRVLGALMPVVPVCCQEVTWRGRTVPLAEIRGELRDATAEAVTTWWSFASDHGYRLILDDAQDVLLVLHQGHARTQARRERPSVEKFLAALGDAQELAVPLLPEVGGDSQPAVLVGAVEKDYAALLDHIARVEPRIAGWAAARAGSVAGFVLSEPLVAAWLDDGRGQEEWDARHELVHRAAQLLLRRSAPQQPPWVALGFGWHVEDSVLGSIYCFPHRAGFVWAAEHSGWAGRLKTGFQASRRRAAGRPPVLAIDEIASWDPMRDPDGFDADRALLAFGVVRHLCDLGPGSAAGAFRGFDTAIRAGWKVQLSETEWTTDPDFRLSAARQQEVLDAAEEGFLDSATQAFARGRLGRPVPRRRSSAADDR